MNGVMTTFIPNRFQEAIYDFVADDRQGNLTIEGLAGTAKTTTIVEALNLIPRNKDVIFLAYNRHIASELRKKAPSWIEVRTTHSKGLEAIVNFNDGRRTNSNNTGYKIHNILDNAVSDRNDEYSEKRNKAEIIGDKTYRENRSALVRIINHFRNNLLIVDEENLDYIITKYDISISGISEQAIIDLVIKTLDTDKADTLYVDFGDMLYLPTTMLMPFEKYDYVFCDECLPNRSRILLANGKEKTIADIVENRLPVKVISLNMETGEQEIKRVIGWSKKPIKERKMIKVTHAEKHKVSGRGNGYYPEHVLFCTDKHPVFTFEKGFTASSKLEIGDEVEFENAHGNKKLKNISGQIYATAPSGNIDCDICGQTCASNSALGSHMRTHDPDYPGNNMSKKGHRVLSENAHIRNQNPEIRRKIGKTISRKMRNGEMPTKFGGYIGNGTYTPQQLVLYNELLKHDERWELEFPVSTGHYRTNINKYPLNYKLDIGFPEHKVGIEIHGRMHRQKKQMIKDQKKQDFLQSKGWLILEIWNNEIDENINDCIDKILSSLVGRSPCKSEIRSVEEVEYIEEFVYDIEVEDNHNFYAEGVLVHNCQDLNESQIRMLLMLRKPDGHIIAVGDRKQSLYGFRGADTEAMEKIKIATDAKSLPLNICYRCPKSHVELANKFVPEMEPAPDAIEGTVKEICFEELEDYIKVGDLAICRNNAPLVRPALDLLRKGIKVNIRGKDIKSSLVDLIKKTNTNDLEKMKEMLIAHLKSEIEIMESKGKNPSFLIDKIEIILEFASLVDTPKELINHIYKLFNDDNAEITFSTVHGAKGMEADNIFFIKPSLIPSPYAKQEWELQGEANVMYVALTRSKNTLYIVED